MEHPKADQETVSGGLREGAIMWIDGVQSRPELNGQQAACLKYVKQKQRWKVRLNNGEEIGLKSSMLLDDKTWAARLELRKNCREAAEATASQKMCAAIEDIAAIEEFNQTVQSDGDQSMRANSVRERLRANLQKQVAADIETIHELNASEADVGGFFSDPSLFAEMRELLKEMDALNDRLFKKSKPAKKVIRQIKVKMDQEQKDRFDLLLHANWRAEFQQDGARKCIYYEGLHGCYAYHVYHTLQPVLSHNLFVATFANSKRNMKELQNFVTLNVTDAQRAAGTALPCWGVQSMRESLATAGNVGMELAAHIHTQLDEVFDEMIDPDSPHGADKVTRRCTVKVRLMVNALLSVHPNALGDENLHLFHDMFTAPMSERAGNIPTLINWRNK